MRNKEQKRAYHLDRDFAVPIRIRNQTFSFFNPHILST